ncbi:MAG: hypothetical protein ACYDBW_04965 [Sulfuricaulis sp.]
MRRWMRPVWMAASLLPALAWANPFAALPLLPSGEIDATGKTVITLKSGDYTHPHFSPDSRYLAFAREFSEGSAALTEIQALDLKTLRVRTLLDAKSSRDFDVYSRLITGFFWNNATTLQATVSDGDVNGANLIYDVSSGKLVAKKPLSDSGTPGHEGEKIDAIANAFPSIPYAVLANALAGGFKVGERQYVVQKNYWQQDNNVWYLDATHKTQIKLVDVPADWIYSLRGAFAYGKDFILLMAYNQDAYLVRYAGGKLSLLYRFTVKNYQQTALRVEFARNERVLFQVVTGPSYEKRQNYLFAYDKTGLQRVKDAGAIDDIDIDPSGRLICLSRWQGEKRELTVKELKDFR